jgi:DNA polymerase-3 subunit gamma/tau
MLTKEAFNALLKTLEEPPKHVIFILATTELDKVPDTIVSRCQTFFFKKPNREIIRKMIVDVAKKEGYELDSGADDLIALLGDGSFRDALGMLQKVISTSSDKKISREEVESITGSPKSDLVNNLM